MNMVGTNSRPSTQLSLLIVALAAAIALALLPNAAFAVESSDALAAGSISSEATSHTSKYAVISTSGWLLRCDSSGNPVKEESTIWENPEAAAKIKVVFVGYEVPGLTDNTASGGQDYAHPRFRYRVDGKNVTKRACLGGEPTEYASIKLTNLKTVSFKVRKEGNACAALADGLFEGSGVQEFVELDSTNVKKIGPRTFANMTKLQSITLPGVCKTINASAFEGCTSLTSISGTGVKTIKDGVFAGCTSLKSLAFNSNLASIGARAFFGCTKLEKISLPVTCTNIGASAFESCTALSSITLADTKATIGDAAFKGCTALTTVDLGKSKSVGTSAFEGCASLSSLDLGTSLKKLGSRALAGCTSLRILELPAKVKSLPIDLFGSEGDPRIPLKLLIMRSTTVVSAADSSVLSLSALAYKTGKRYVYVPKTVLKQYKKSAAWAPYAARFKAMPEMSKAKVTVKGGTYTGQEICPVPKVKLGKKKLKAGIDFEVTYKNNVNAGTATVTVVGKGIYLGKTKAKFTIAKARNPLSVRSMTRYLKDTEVAAKAGTVYGSLMADGAQGTTTFAKVSGSKKLTMDATGKVTVKKGTPIGTYAINVQVTAAGNRNYNPATKKGKLYVRVCSEAEYNSYVTVDKFLSVVQREYQLWIAGKTPSDKYWRAFNSEYQSWCSEFVGWCLRDSGLVLGVTMPSNPTYAKAYYNFYRDHPQFGTIHVNDGTYTPKPGDIVLQVKSGERFWHTEMVTSYSNGRYQGYSGGTRVGPVDRPLTNREMKYFITINWGAV